MSYMLEIYNTSDNVTWTKVAQLHESECDCKIKRTLNSDWNIEITYIIPPGERSLDKSDYLTSWNAKVRVFNFQDATDYQTFLIKKTILKKATGGQNNLVATGNHISIELMQKKIVNAVYDFSNVTISEALSTIINNHPFGYTLGTCEPTAKITVSISWETVTSALQKLLDACSGEYDIDETTNEINIFNSLGEIKPIILMPERNNKSIQLTKYDTDVITKIYGIGSGTPPVTMARARHVILSIVGSLITFDNNKVVPENDTWNGYKIKVVTGANADSYFDITDCVHGAIYDTITYSGDISETALPGDKIELLESSGNDVDYVKAIASIASHDTIESVNQNTDYGNAVNLVETPYLDGTYTAGLCKNWNKTGSPTVSKNTDTDYIQYGSKSQKVICAAKNDGIYQDIAGVISGNYYRIKANVWLNANASMSKINVYIGTSPAQAVGDDIESDSTDGKWVSFDLWAKFSSTTTRITILQNDTEPATFYVDAVQISECPEDEGQNFTSNSEATDLWNETFDALMDSKDPVIEYKCNFVDLYRMNPVKFPYDKINMGDTIYITDRELKIISVPARVKEMNVNLFHPELTEHIVSNVI